MQRTTRYLVALGAVIIAVGCSTDRSMQPSDAPSGIRKDVGAPACTDNTTIKKEIQALFPAGTRGSAISQFQHVIDRYNQGNTVAAQALAAQFYKQVKQQYDAGALVGAGTPAGAAAVATLGDNVFCAVGIHVTLSLTLDDNVVAVVSPNTDTTVRTGTSNAGVQLFAAQGLPQELVVITRLPDNSHTATCPQFSGPLCTPLAQFPPFYDYQLVPAPQLGLGAPPFNVEECVDTSQVHVPLAQLFIAHNVGADTAQVLPKAGGNLGLACDQAVGMGRQRSLFELARRGRVGSLAMELASRAADFLVPPAYALFSSTGVTGQTRSFSPFGIVDVNDLVPYRNGKWTYHAPAYPGIPATPNVGDIAGFEQPSFTPDGSWVMNASPFGDAPFGGGNQGVGCTLSLLPYLNTVWPSFPQPSSSPPPDEQVATIFLLRQTFIVPPSLKQDLQVGVAIDNDVQIFINGVQLPLIPSSASATYQTHEGCAAQDSFVYTVPQAMLLTDQPNLIAVRARDRGGESYIDARVSLKTPVTP